MAERGSINGVSPSQPLPPLIDKINVDLTPIVSSYVDLQKSVFCADSTDDVSSTMIEDYRCIYAMYIQYEHCFYLV